MRDGGVLRSRKGMSPLIATVLLMAFAVALGGMIMNWSIDAGANSDCEKIKVSVTQFCAKDGRVTLSMASSSQSIPLRGIKLNILQDNVESTLSVKESDLAPGMPMSLSIPYGGGMSARVDLVGVIGSAADPYTCNDRPIESVNPIVECQ